MTEIMYRENYIFGKSYNPYSSALGITVLILSMLISVIDEAWGFDSVPEYRTVLGDRPLSETMKLIDAEYSSDFLTYQLPFSAEEVWLQGDDTYQFSVGSLSSREFLVEQRLRLSRPLAGPVDFRLTWFEERDWDENQQDFFWELGLHTENRLRYFIFGNVSLFKADDDVGIGLEFLNHHDRLWRLSFMRPDFQRNQRSADGTKWYTKPTVWSLVGSRVIDNTTTHQNYQYYVRYEPRSILHNGTDSSLRELEKTTFGGSKSDGQWALQLHYDHKREGRDGDQGSGLPREIFRSQRLWLGLSRLIPLEKSDLSVGLYTLNREFEKNSLTARIQDWVPTLWLLLPPREHSDWQHKYSIGFDVVSHALANQDAILADHDDHSLNSRLNLKLDMLFPRSHGQLGLLFSADIDRLGTSEAWEGGAAQLHLEF